MSWHQAQCVLCHDVARIAIPLLLQFQLFLKEGVTGQSIKWGSNGIGGVVSPLSVDFFHFFVTVS